MKIAIIKLSSLGDIIHAAVVLQFIKRQLPNATIDWFIDSSFQAILEGNSDIANIIPLKLRTAKKQKILFIKEFFHIWSYRHKYDLVIDLQGLVKSALIARLLGNRIVGFDQHSLREHAVAWLYRKAINIPYTSNTIDRYRLLAANACEIEISPENIHQKQPYLAYQEADFASAKPFFSEQLPNIIFTVGSTWASRIYPAEQFVQIANQLQANILIPYGNSEEQNRAKFIATTSTNTNIHVLPKMNLTQLVATISHADLLIGGDSGPSYIAWANNVPAVLLFGPTPTSRIYTSQKLRVLKSPSKVDPYKLDKNDFSIKEITPEEILEAAQQLLTKH